MKTLFLFFSLLFSISLVAQNAKPFVIPELKEWKASDGVLLFYPKIKIVSDEASNQVARQFAADYKDMFGKKLKLHAGRSNSAGVISFTIHPDSLKANGEEAYSIDIGTSVQVTANSTTGLYWATRTLLQMLE